MVSRAKKSGNPRFKSTPLESNICLYFEKKYCHSSLYVISYLWNRENIEIKLKFVRFIHFTYLYHFKKNNLIAWFLHVYAVYSRRDMRPEKEIPSRQCVAIGTGSSFREQRNRNFWPSCVVQSMDLVLLWDTSYFENADNLKCLWSDK